MIGCQRWCPRLTGTVMSSSVLTGWCGVPEVHWPPVVGYVPAYAIGTFAAFWFFQRLAASLTG
jgi:hypothetical protein